MPGVLCTVAYDGTAFSGWARQPSARTVQGTLEAAIESMNGAPARTRGASRTDRGVHALGQRAAFDAAREIAAEGWAKGLNAALPEDVAVVAASECEAGYDPRFDTVDKTYRYLVLSSPLRDPLLRQRAWWVREALDARAMREAAELLVGRHDFRAFRAADDARENTVRTISSLAVERGYAGDPRVVVVTVTGDAFMKNMVRILTGTLVEVGAGRRAPGSVGALLGEAATRPDAGPTAPPEGLTLLEVRLGRPAADRA